VKNQLNAANIVGALVSAGLLVLSHFSPVREVASKTSKLFVSQKRKTTPLIRTPSSEHNNAKTQMPPAPLTTQIQVPSFNKVEKSQGQRTVLRTQEQEPDSIQLMEKSQQLPSKSNNCPKNIDYFTKKPRPKQMPEECITCKNLINCACQTSD
jgi:hypothetical protein